METIELIPKEIVDKTNVTLKKAESLQVTIVNDVDYEKSADVLRDIKTWYNAIFQERKKILDPHEKTRSAIVAFFSKPLTMLQEKERTIKMAISQYRSKKELERRKEQERLTLEAKEREKKEKERLEKRIETAKKNDNKEQVKELKEMQKTVFVPPPTVETPIKKVDGIITKKKWKAQVVSFKDLDDKYKIPNQSMLDAIAQASKGTTEIKGVKFYSVDIIAAKKK